MSEKPLSLRVLKLVLAVWWWGMIVASVVAVGFLAVLPPTDAEFAMIGYASDIDTSALTAHDRDGQELAVQFDGPAKVKLLLPGETNLTMGHKVISLLLVAPLLLTCIYFVKQLRDIVRTIDENNPFASENAGRVRIIGGLILVFEVVRCIVVLAVSGFADSMVIAEGFNLNGRIQPNLGLIVVGIAVIVLSEVFRHGARLREEQALTV